MAEGKSDKMSKILLVEGSNDLHVILHIRKKIRA